MPAAGFSDGTLTTCDSTLAITDSISTYASGSYDFHVSRNQDFTFPWKSCINTMTEGALDLLNKVVVYAFDQAQAACINKGHWQGVVYEPNRFSYSCNNYNGTIDIHFPDGYPKTLQPYLQSVVNSQCAAQNSSTGLSPWVYVGIAVGGVILFSVAGKASSGFIKGCCSGLFGSRSSPSHESEPFNDMEAQHNRQVVHERASALLQ